MGIVLLAFIVAIVLSLAIEDFRTRTVSVWWLAVFGVFQIAFSVLAHGVGGFLWNLSLNAALLLLLAIATGFYCRLRFRERWRQAIGGGDLVFALLLTPAFPFPEFPYFLVVSLSLTLVAWVVCRMAGYRKTEDIPLVSGLGICYLLYLGYSRFMTAL